MLPHFQELLGGFDGSLEGTWELLGRRGLGDSQWDGKIPSLECQEWPLPASVSLLRGASIPLCPAGEATEAQGEDAVSNPGRQDLCLQGHRQPVGYPVSPTLPLAHCLGCLCKVEPSKSGNREAAGITPIPRAGGPGWGRE